MLKDKQIREMARIMNETCNVYDEQGNHIRNKCGECEEWSSDNHCCCSYNSKEAEALYNAGYRKQNEGEWVCQYDTDYGTTDVTCSVCGDTRTINGCYVDIYDKSIYTEDNFCPNCGAKMKGAE